jgi:acetyl esterase/lipase
MITGQMFRDKAQGTDTKPLLNAADIHMARNFFKLFYSIKRGSRPSASRLSCTTKDIRIPVRDGTLIPARVYTPRMLSPAPGCPCMYVCHGGGYVFGELDGQEELCELFSSMGGVAIDVLYRHAPEHPFPTAISDSYDGLDWVRCQHFPCA